MTYRNNASAIFEASVLTGDASELLAVARGIVPAWADADDVDVTVIHGGITNQLYKLSGAGRPSLLVRVYGTNTEVVIDREGENALFARLSEQGFAPTYHGRFNNGRIEGFLEGFRPLEPHEMALLRHQIAPELRRMHAIPPVSAEPRLWQTLRGWMDAALSVEFTGSQAERYAALDLPRFDALLRELEADFQLAADSRGAREALRPVLAHNDLLSGNVLTNGEVVRFIDYEYGACSFAGFDVANHFCEYAGFDSDFRKHFPTREVRDDFVRHYLGPDFDDADVTAFSDEVERFVLPDHLWWGTWAVVQARWSPIDFDFMEYAQLRLDGCDLHSDGL